MRPCRAIPCLAVAFFLGGCSTPSPEPLRTPEPPVLALPATDTPAPFPHEWWTLFGDPELDRLIALAREQNRDLAQAAARIDAARANARIAGADAALRLDAVGGLSRQRGFRNAGALSGHYQAKQFDAGLELSYEVDLWGRVRALRTAAEKDLALTLQERAAAEISLCAQVARFHLNRRALRREAEIVRQQLAQDTETERLLDIRASSGFATDLDVERTRIEKATREGELAQLRESEQALANALALFCGQSSSPSGSLADANVTLPPVPNALSLALLEARPDVAAKRSRWEAALARVQTARAEFYPAVRLAGSFGYAAEHPEDLLEWRSRLWSLIGSLTAPVLDGGRLKGNLELAAAQLKEASAAYESAVLTAYREVSDALNASRALAEQQTAAGQRLAAADRALALSRERYDKGFATYLEVVDSTRSRLAAQRTLVQLDAARQCAAVDLIRALGLP